MSPEIESASLAAAISRWQMCIRDRLWDNVLSSEKIYIEPHRAQAHGVVDTTLGYELQALQPYIVPLLRELPESVPGYAQVQVTLKGLSHIAPLDSRRVPADSILREFIGTMPL